MLFATQLLERTKRAFYKWASLYIIGLDVAYYGHELCELK